MTGNKDKMEYAVVYARYSSHTQQEQSIEGQLAAAHKYADAKGYTVIREYCDRAKTGTNDNREEFQQMLSDCAKHHFSVIIVWKVDRFGRNREEITFNKYRAKKNGVRIEYVAESMPEGPEGVILESVLEGMAEYFSLQLSQNVKRGLLESAKKHKVINSKVPLGYRVSSDRHYEIDPNTAPLAKLIFQKYAEGTTLSDLIRYLNGCGYKTNLGRSFGRSYLSEMLKNEKYIGVYAFKDIIRDEDAIPALIDRKLFDNVQARLSMNRRAPSRSWTYSDYILTGKLFCGQCGSSMVGRSGHNHADIKYDYYYCKKKMDHAGCDRKPVSREWVENLVLDKIVNLLNDEDAFEFIAEKTWQYYLHQSEEQVEITSLREELEKTEKSIANLIKSIESGIDISIIKPRLDVLNLQKTAIKKALTEHELSQGFKLTKEHIIFFLDRFRQMDLNNRRCQKKMIQAFVNAIFLYNDHFIIAFNYTDNGEIERQTITLSDIEKTDTCDSSHVSATAGLSGQNANLHLVGMRWIGSVFILTYSFQYGK